MSLPAEIAETAATHSTPEEVAQALIDRANSRGGEDNISAVVILMESADSIEPEDPPDPSIYTDTEVGLYQAPLSEDILDDTTVELPPLTLNLDDLPDEEAGS
jgi:serine/threonine protein phosphatase PrpC